MLTSAQSAGIGTAGSEVRITHLSVQQIQGLHLLGRVWGFLKYHHPRVTSGNVPWDAELLRMLPRVLDARDSAEAESRIVEWIDSLGEVSQCNPCAQLSPSRLQRRRERLTPAAARRYVGVDIGYRRLLPR